MGVGVIGNDIIKAHAGGGSGPTLTSISTLADGLGLHPYSLLGSVLRAFSDMTPTANFRIASLPSVGTLTVNGNPVTAGVTLLLDGDTFEWDSPDDVQGNQTAFTVVAWDGVHASSPPVPVLLSVLARSMAFTFHTGTNPTTRTITFVTATGFASTHWTFVGATEDITVTATNPNTQLGHNTADYVITRYGDPTGPTVWSINKAIKNITLLPVSLTSINIQGTTVLGAVDLTGLSALTTFVTTSASSGLSALTLTGCTSLTTIDVHQNSGGGPLTALNVAPSVGTLSSINIAANNVPTAGTGGIDDILAKLAAGTVNTGTLSCSGTSMGTPTGGDYNGNRLILLSRGWTVISNP